MKLSKVKNFYQFNTIKSFFRPKFNSKFFLFSKKEITKIITFENQTVYLPCAMQSMTFSQLQPQDQLTLILWYRSWNTIGGPIYSVDFRNLDRNILNIEKKAIHFISGELKDRIVFEFNTCWQPHTYQQNLWIYKSFRNFNKSIINNSNQSTNHQNKYHYFKANNYLNSSLKNSNGPICAFLKVNQVKLNDNGRFSCRIDFRRSRTLHTHFLVKVLGKY